MSYKGDLLADLKDLDYAAKYLSASIKESIDTFLTALRDVVDAHKETLASQKPPTVT